MKLLLALALAALPSVATAQTSVPTDNRGDSYALPGSSQTASTTSRIGKRWGKSRSRRSVARLGGGLDYAVPSIPPDPRDKFDLNVNSLTKPN